MDAGKRRFFFVRLQGKTLQFFFQLPNTEHEGTFSKIVDFFLAKFEPAETIQLRRAEFQGRWQQPNESFSDLAQALCWLSKHVYPSMEAVT